MLDIYNLVRLCVVNQAVLPRVKGRPTSQHVTNDANATAKPWHGTYISTTPIPLRNC
jgi:hypothetical protein